MSDSEFGTTESNQGGAIQPPAPGGWVPPPGTPPPAAPSGWGAPSGPSDAVPPPPSYGQQPNGQQRYGQQPYGQPAGSDYGQPMYQQYGYAPGATTTLNPYESRGSTIMVLGILGLVACQIMGPVAWIMGRTLKSEAEAAGWPEPGNAKAGRICGIIATCLLAFSVVMVVIWLIFFVAIAGSSSVN